LVNKTLSLVKSLDSLPYFLNLLCDFVVRLSLSLNLQVRQVLQELIYILFNLAQLEIFSISLRNKLLVLNHHMHIVQHPLPDRFKVYLFDRQLLLSVALLLGQILLVSRLQGAKFFISPLHYSVYLQIIAFQLRILLFPLLKTLLQHLDFFKLILLVLV